MGYYNLAKIQDQHELFRWIITNHLHDHLALLLSYGADPNEFQSLTEPLSYAIYEDDVIATLMLYASGVNIHKKLNGGWDGNALILSVLNSSYEVTRCLLNIGIDPNHTRNKTINLPLHIALYNKDMYMVELLLRYGADPKIKNYENDNGFDIARKTNSIIFFRDIMRRIDNQSNKMISKTIS